jgi:hypothetical protein
LWTEGGREDGRNPQHDFRGVREAHNSGSVRLGFVMPREAFILAEVGAVYSGGFSLLSMTIVIVRTVSGLRPDGSIDNRSAGWQPAPRDV